VLQTKEKGTSIILIDEKGKIKAHKNRRLVEKSNIFNVIDDKKAVQKINKILEYLKTDSLLTGSLYISFNKEKYYAAIKYIKSIKWYQIVLVKTNELIKLSYFFPLIATGIISFVIFFALIIVITEKIIIIPIALLNKNVASVSKGNFNIKSEITSEDELGTLQKTFTKMACTVKDYTENLEEKVRVRTCELKNKNLLILDSINYAKRLQTSVLPDEESLKSCFKEHFILWKPKDIVGGDFYWLKKLEDGNFVFAVADCTGHGVPGALMAMLAATLLSGVVSNKCNSDPALILTELDKELRAALKQDNVKTQSNDGLEIGLCLCRPKENTLIYAGSKLMLISVYDKTITITKGDKSKIGYKKQKKSLPFRSTNHIINYKKGTFFYISSDGYYDQNGLNSEYPFGKKKFVNMLKSFYSISMQEQAGYAESAITHFMGDIPQRDDITLAGFKL
jgi:serine phosphatase RsbU (regulator of sigma subunit)